MCYGFLSAALLVAHVSAGSGSECETWYDSTTHGSTFRSVRDFGAKGDGQSDDTIAIQKAIDHNRGSVDAKLPAVVYIPPGEYVVSDTIVLTYHTELAGSFACPPLLKLAQGAKGFDGKLGYKPVITTWNGFNTSEGNHSWWLDSVVPNLFYVQLRHLRLKLGNNPGAVGVLWGVAQQTALRDVDIDAAGASIALDVGGGCGYAPTPQVTNVCHDAGGGGVVEDVVINGGRIGLRFSASQWFFRNISVRGSEDACLQNHKQAWSFVFLNLLVSHCPVGFSYAKGNNVIIADSDFSDISGGSAVVIADESEPFPGLVLSRVSFNNVAWAVKDTLRASDVIEAWAGGVLAGQLQESALVPVSHVGAPQGRLPSRPRPTFSGREILNVLDYARGDGVQDDTQALQGALLAASREGKVVFFPYGTYKVSQTLQLPSGCTVVGEGLPRIELAPAAPGFGDCGRPEPVLLAAEGGVTMVGVTVTSGPDNCAMLLDLGPGDESQLFDMHLLAQHSTHTLLRVRGPVLVDNAWGWSADHSLHDWTNIDPPIASLRGLHALGDGPMYFYGTCFEHHLEFQYSFEASNFTVLQLQTENPYYGPTVTTALPVHVPLNATGVLAGIELLSWFGLVPAGVATSGPVKSKGSIHVFGMYTAQMEALVGGSVFASLPEECKNPLKDGFFACAVALPDLLLLSPESSHSYITVIVVIAIALAIIAVCLLVARNWRSLSGSNKHEDSSTETASDEE